MTSPTPPVFEQVDREAAWPYSPARFKDVDRPDWLAGRYDHTQIIEAFARHRLSARKAAMIEAAGIAEAHQPDSKSLARCHPEDRVVIRAERKGEVIAANIIADAILQASKASQ